MHFDGQRRMTYFAGAWWDVPGPASFPGGHSTFIEAWWYHYPSGTWYEVGECRVSAAHLIPGLQMVYEPR